LHKFLVLIDRIELNPNWEKEMIILSGNFKV